MGKEMTTPQLVSDIQAAVAGDEDAWQRLLATYRPAMEQWSSSFSADGELSRSDLVQTAWFQVFEGLDKFNGVENPDDVAPMFYQWLKVTARNAMLTLIKHRNRKRRKPDQPFVNGHDFVMVDRHQKTPSSIVAHDEQLERLRNAIENMNDPLDKQIVGMIVEDGLSLRMVANLLGRDYSTIRRRFLRIIASLGSRI